MQKTSNTVRSIYPYTFKTCRKHSYTAFSDPSIFFRKPAAVKQLVQFTAPSCEFKSSRSQFSTVPLPQGIAICSVNQRLILRQETNQKTLVLKTPKFSMRSISIFWKWEEWFLYRIPISVRGFMSIRMKKAIVFPCHKRAPKIQGYERKQDMWWLWCFHLTPWNENGWVAKGGPPDFTLDIVATQFANSVCNVKANSTAQEFAQDAIYWCLGLHHAIAKIQAKKKTV